jgi:exonuclease III
VFYVYSPIDCKDGGVEEEVERQSFYNLLFACLKQVLTSDKLVVLGDFNAELSSNWED